MNPAGLEPPTAFSLWDLDLQGEDLKPAQDLDMPLGKVIHVQGGASSGKGPKVQGNASPQRPTLRYQQISRAEIDDVVLAELPEALRKV